MGELLDQHVVSAWFDQARLHSVDDGLVIIDVQSKFVATQINNRFWKELHSAVFTALPKATQIHVRAASASVQAAE